MMQILAPPPRETWRDNFIQDAPESLARSIWEQLSLEASQVNLDRLDLKQFYSMPISKSFIFRRQDRAMPGGYFHQVMFTRPAELADKTIAASAD